MAHRMEAYFPTQELPQSSISDRQPLEHDAVRKLITWKPEQRLLDPLKCRSYQQ